MTGEIPHLGQAVQRRVDLRILTPAMLAFFLSLMDRTNIALAGHQMMGSLALGATTFGFITGIFYAGFALSGIPVSLLTARNGASRLLALLIITWGLSSTAMAAAPNAAWMLVARFIFGVAEGGFSPAVLIWLAQWYPDSKRTRATSFLVVPQCAAGLLGGPLGGLLLALGHTDGWRLMFLCEGAPAIALGVFWLSMPDRPAQARWLFPEGRAWLLETLAKESEHRIAAGQPVTFGSALRHPAMWIYILMWFGVLSAFYGFVAWLPQILRVDLHERASEFQIGLLVAAPSVIGIGTAVVVSHTLPRTGDRRWHLIFVCGFAGLALVAATLTDSALYRVGLYAMALGMAIPVSAAFWSVPLSVLEGAAAAGGVAVINTVGTLGGLVSPALMGYLYRTTGSFKYSILAVAGFFFWGALGPILFKRFFPPASVGETAVLRTMK